MWMNNHFDFDCNKNCYIQKIMLNNNVGKGKNKARVGFCVASPSHLVNVMYGGISWNKE